MNKVLRNLIDAEEANTVAHRLLSACVWTHLTDASITNKDAWAVYRTTLRNLPQTQTDPFNITWPEPPQ